MPQLYNPVEILFLSPNSCFKSVLYRWLLEKQKLSSLLETKLDNLKAKFKAHKNPVNFTKKNDSRIHKNFHPTLGFDSVSFCGR